MQSNSLGKRLDNLSNLVSDNYQHIWDCCCDHGLLGMALMEQKFAANIHFVDIVPELIESVTNKLRAKHPNSAQRTTHCIDASQLPLDQYEGKHLVIIAGIGGDLSKHIVQSIHKAHPNVCIDYLLCPVRQLYSLRDCLRGLHFSVKKERLVEENGRIYELILTTPNNDESGNLPLIDQTGRDIWRAHNDLEKDVAQRYHQQILSHYQRMLARKEERVEAILRAYQDISIEQISSKTLPAN